jgi:hypothetical protein
MTWRHELPDRTFWFWEEEIEVIAQLLIEANGFPGTDKPWVR